MYMVTWCGVKFTSHPSVFIPKGILIKMSHCLSGIKQNKKKDLLEGCLSLKHGQCNRGITSDKETISTGQKHRANSTFLTWAIIERLSALITQTAWNMTFKKEKLHFFLSHKKATLSRTTLNPLKWSKHTLVLTGTLSGGVCTENRSEAEVHAHTPVFLSAIL